MTQTGAIRAAVAVSLAVALVTALDTTPATGGSAVTCQVTNLTAGTGPGDSLQLMVDDATPADVLQVEGACEGGVPDHQEPRHHR